MTALAATALCMALVAVTGIDLTLLFGHTSPRVHLPRHAGQTRPASDAAVPDEGSATAGSGGPAPDPPVPGAGPLPLCVETHPLYATGAQPILSQEAADEIWWSL